MSGLIVPFIGIERPMVIAKCYWRQIIGMLLQRGQPGSAEQWFRCDAGNRIEVRNAHQTYRIVRYVRAKFCAFIR
ncbi:hypothetical protein CCL24_06180 [Pseudomonas congelans]|nr:hypothetical protein CCL24_06180 [Pseudomonas congelans]PBQ11909.1 hypothetical protein CCL08_24340 [Pseudomonas congelans]